jgi:hypothetical protein
MEAIIISSKARFPTTARSTSAITCLLSDETLEISVTVHSDEKNKHSRLNFEMRHHFMVTHSNSRGMPKKTDLEKIFLKIL